MCHHPALRKPNTNNSPQFWGKMSSFEKKKRFGHYIVIIITRRHATKKKKVGAITQMVLRVCSSTVINRAFQLLHLNNLESIDLRDLRHNVRKKNGLQMKCVLIWKKYGLTWRQRKHIFFFQIAVSKIHRNKRLPKQSNKGEGCSKISEALVSWDLL